MSLQENKPVFLNLLRIKLPWMGIASILHRISGALLFLSIPLSFYLFGLSLDGDPGFKRTVAIMESLPFKLFSVLLLWAILHHLLAGIRFMLIDLNVGVYLPEARQSALGVIIGGIVLAMILWLILS